jgi:predicted amidohydrolase YtcJ
MDTLIEVDRVIPLTGRRWVVQHFGPMSEAHCEAAARLGLVLTPLTSRYIYKEGYRDKKIPEADFVPFNRLARLGVPVTLSTDNAPPSLFEAIWHTVARRDRFGRDVPPETEKLSRVDALRCATVNGAYATFEEKERGTLEPGKLADFAVLTHDPLSCPEDDLRDIRALMTVVDGRVVYQDPKFA